MKFKIDLQNRNSLEHWNKSRKTKTRSIQRKTGNPNMKFNFSFSQVVHFEKTPLHVFFFFLLCRSRFAFLDHEVNVQLKAKTHRE